jgi:uncharacterized membrane protein
MKTKIFPSLLLAFVLIFSIAFAQDYSVSVAVSPKNLTVAPCKGVSFDITITNAGNKEDTYQILLDGINSDWYSLSQDSITLGAGKSDKVYLFVTPDCLAKAGNYKVNVTASGLSTDSDIFTMEIIPDHIINLVVPNETTTCLKEENTFSIKINNAGKFSEDVELSVSGDASDLVTLSEETFTIDKGETQNVTVTVNPTDIEAGGYNLEITAKSTTSYAGATDFTLINVVDCYKVDVTAPDQLEACVNVPTNFNITVQNVGLKDDVYNVSISDINYEKTTELKPQESKTFEVEYSKDAEGTYELGYVVSSTHTSQEGTINATVLKYYAVSMSTEETSLNIDAGKGKLIKTTVTNDGTKADTFEITSDVDWVSIKPASVTLDSGESKDAYIYYSPEFGTAGTYETTLTVKSGNSETSQQITVAVGGATVTTAETTIPEGNETTIETTQPEENATSTTTPQIPTGEFLKQLEDLFANKLVRSVLIAIVVVAIILIVIYLVVMR